MEYKITIMVECEDEREISRQYMFKEDRDYNTEINDIINNLEKEF